MLLFMYDYCVRTIESHTEHAKLRNGIFFVFWSFLSHIIQHIYNTSYASYIVGNYYLINELQERETCQIKIFDRIRHTWETLNSEGRKNVEDEDEFLLLNCKTWQTLERYWIFCGRLEEIWETLKEEVKMVMS